MPNFSSLKESCARQDICSTSKLAKISHILKMDINVSYVLIEQMFTLVVDETNCLSV